MPTTKVDRLKTWLDAAGVKQSNFALWQVINALIDVAREGQQNTAIVADAIENIVVEAIEELTTDVVAVGPGVVPAIIQPDAVTTLKIIDDAVTTPKIADNNVTYGKIQQVTGLRLVGNSDASTADMVEIPLGSGIGFFEGELVVEITPGVPGLLHDLLSATHPDTIAASPVFGDLIRAGEGGEFEGDYYHGIILNPYQEDGYGTYAGLMLGFPDSGLLPPIGGALAPPAFSVVDPVELPDTWLAWDIIQGIVQNPVYTAEEGIYGWLSALVPGGTEPGPGAYVALSCPDFPIIAAPSLELDVSTGLWERMPIGTDDQVLTIVDGQVEWEDLPPPPTFPIVIPWQEIPFDAGDFTAAGGATPDWTVIEANVARWEYQYFESEGNDENSVRIALYVRDTTVSGSAPTQLLIELPFNIIGEWGQVISLQENLVSVTDAFVAYGGAIPTNFLSIQKIPFDGSGPAFDTTASGTFLSFEISARLAP